MQASEPGTGTADEARDVVLDAIRSLVGIAALSLAAIGDDVSLPQFRILVLLDGRGPSTMGTLAEALEVNPSTVTRACDRLEEKKLVRRRPDDDDRRSVRAQLTARGRRLVEQVVARRTAHVEEILARLSVAGQQRLASALREFVDAAGAVAHEAWTLGWSASVEDDDD